MTLEQLKAQLASLENEQEAAKAAFYRAEGAIVLVKHLISEAEAPPVKDSSLE